MLRLIDKAALIWFTLKILSFPFSHPYIPSQLKLFFYIFWSISYKIFPFIPMKLDFICKASRIYDLNCSTFSSLLWLSLASLTCIWVLWIFLTDLLAFERISSFKIKSFDCLLVLCLAFFWFLQWNFDSII